MLTCYLVSGDFPYYSAELFKNYVLKRLRILNFAIASKHYGDACIDTPRTEWIAWPVISVDKIPCPSQTVNSRPVNQ